MLHVRKEEDLKKYISIINNEDGCDELIVSKEVEYLVKKFLNLNWNVYLTTLENIDVKKELWSNVYCITPEEYRTKKDKKGKRINLNIDNVNSLIDIIMIRNVGSVEANFHKLQDY